MKNHSKSTKNTIPFARPKIGRPEERAVRKVLRSGWLTTGNEALQFEKEFAAYTKSRYALALNSATSGLHLALEAVGVKEGDLVVTSPLTFTSTAEVARYLNAEVLFVDCDPNTGCLSPEQFKIAVKKHNNIKAVIPIHLAGRLCDIKSITEIARDNGIAVIEDAAHSFPVWEKEKSAGTFGDVGVFSFYATKTITTGEGGMLITDNEEIYNRAKKMRLHGIDRDCFNRYTASAKSNSWQYDIVAPGYKYNLSDISAALGRVQLTRAEDFKQARTKIAQCYREAFANIDSLILPEFTESHAWHLFIIHINQDKLSLSRNDFISRLHSEGISTSVHFIPLHLMSYYKERYNTKPEDFPGAMTFWESAFSLPIYPSLKKKEIKRIIQAITSIATKGSLK